jgi:cobyrinic acid a,c-diamide synthase
LVAVSSLADRKLPDIDGLYIGGGFPETFAERLADNDLLLASVRDAALHDLPIYAECGGLIYLCRSLQWQGKTYPLAGVFPLQLVMNPKPVGHGYTSAQVEAANPFFEIGCEIKGHEFHYSGPSGGAEDAPGGCLRLKTGVGLGNGRDGLLYKSTMACYTHIHAAGVPDWAGNFVAAARGYRTRRGSSGGSNSVARLRSFC